MTRRKPHRVADDLGAGMQAIERMIASGKQPNELFTARTIEIPDPSEYAPRDIRALRDSVHVGQRQQTEKARSAREKGSNKA